MKTSDPLSSFLRLLRIAKLVVGEAVLSSGQEIEASAGQLSFYAVRSGSCLLKLSGATKVHRLQQGNFVLLTEGMEHSLQNEAASEANCVANELTTRSFSVGKDINTEKSCVIVFGHAPIQPLAGNPFKQNLPDVIRIHRDESDLLDASHPLLDMISQECHAPCPGSAATNEQLVQVLIMQTVRSHLACKNSLSVKLDASHPSSLLQASANPLIGPILNAIHDYPGDPWTVIGLAKRSRMSKSAFSEKFRDLVGQSPMQYVTEVRFQKACEMLSATDLDIQQIANLSGYGSASSFSTAFRQKLGQSPMAYRGVLTRSSSITNTSAV